MIGRVLLLVNPASRRGAREEPRAEAALRAAGVSTETRRTERAGHARDLAEALSASVDAVFTLGGDGTAMEVLQAAAAAGRPVGVLPGGTGNLLARALGTPLSVPRAVRALLRGSDRRIDLGVLADGRTFAFAAGTGIDVAMLRHTSAASKRRFGVLAYAATFARASLRPRPFPLRVTVDGRTVTRDASVAFIANFGSVLGGLVTLGPGIAADDGQLDVCVFAPRTVRDALAIGWRVLRRDFSGSAMMHFEKGASITLECDPPRQVQADGELLGLTPLTCRVLPLAARILVPSGRQSRGALSAGSRFVAAPGAVTAE